MFIQKNTLLILVNFFASIIMILFANLISTIKETVMEFFKTHKTLIIILCTFILVFYFLAREKTFDNDFYKNFAHNTHAQIQTMFKEQKTTVGVGEMYDNLRGIAYSFNQDQKLPLEYKETMYDCIGYKIFNENNNTKIFDTLQGCKDDFEKNNGKSVYYNHAWLLREFSPWNGSYLPLERIIQKHIRKPESYEHLKTEYKMVFDDKRPHMFVAITYKGVNMYRQILKQTMSAKVDAKTKEIYDLKNLVR